MYPLHENSYIAGLSNAFRFFGGVIGGLLEGAWLPAGADAEDGGSDSPMVLCLSPEYECALFGSIDFVSSSSG